MLAEVDHRPGDWAPAMGQLVQVHAISHLAQTWHITMPGLDCICAVACPLSYVCSAAEATCLADELHQFQTS